MSATCNIIVITVVQTTHALEHRSLCALPLSTTGSVQVPRDFGRLSEPFVYLIGLFHLLLPAERFQSLFKCKRGQRRLPFLAPFLAEFELRA